VEADVKQALNPYSHKTHIVVWLFLLMLLTTTRGTFAQDGWLPALEEIARDPERIEALVRIGQGHPREVLWSPDGGRIAVASSVGVWLYDAQSLDIEPLLFEDGTAPVLGMAFSADSSRLAFSGDRVYVWDINENRLLQTIETEDGVLSVAFSPDGTELVTARGFYQGDHDVIVWSVETGDQVKVLDGGGVVADLHYSPDGRYIAGIQLGDCCFGVSIWDAATGEELYIGDIQGPADEHLLVFSADSQTLAVVDRSGVVILWDLATMTDQGFLYADDFNSDDYYAPDAAFSIDGQQFMTLSQMGILRVWNVETMELVESIERQPARYGAFSPDLTQVATIDTSQQISISDVESGEVTAQRDFVSINSDAVAFNPDSSLMAFAVNNDVWLWDMTTGERAAVLSGHEDSVTDVAFSFDDTQIASSSADGTVRFWDAASGELDQIFVTLNAGITQIIFNEDIDLMVATERTVRIFDLATGRAQLVFYYPEMGTTTDTLEPGYVEDVAYSGGRLAIATLNGVALWTKQNSDGTGQQSIVLQSRFGSIHAVDFDESWLYFAGMDGAVVAWYLYENEFGGVVGTNNSWVYAIASSPDGFVFASAGCAQTLSSVWDGSLYCAGAELRLSSLQGLTPPIIVPQGHKNIIRNVAFNADSTLLATSSEDGSIILWGVPTQEDS
jgi:WD40 repeat protein